MNCYIVFMVVKREVTRIAMDDARLAELLGDAGRGDADAFQRLVVHYHSALRAVVSRRIGGALQSKIEPDDVLQEAYIAAFEHVGDCEFDGSGGFYKWLEAIALNELKGRIRGLHRQKRDVDRELGQAAGVGNTSYQGLLEGLSGGDPTPSRQLRQEEAVAAAMTSLARLKPDQREVIRRRFLLGTPVKQIAVELGRQEARIYQLCHEGLTTLREQMVSISRFLSGM